MLYTKWVIVYISIRKEDQMQPVVPQKLPLSKIDWAGLVPAIAEANRAIAQYEGVLYGVPNPEVLLSPLTTREAVLSSRIEGTRATFNEVLQFEAGEEIDGESKRQDIQEIINYRRALTIAEKELKKRPFNLNLLLKLHGALLDSVRGRDKGRGRFRTIQNWIGKPNTPIEEAEFVPPEPLTLKDHLDNWEKYFHHGERDMLVQLSIIHAQFEIIHPFLDGNGRIGRIIIPLFLYEKGLLSQPMLYISEYLETNRDKYVGLLRMLNGPETWIAWIEFFLLAVTQQAQDNLIKARGILDLYQQMKDKFLELTHSQYAIPLLDCLFFKPIITSAELMRSKGMPSKPMVMNLIKILKKQGILKLLREGSGRRPQILVLADLINISEGKKVF